MGRGRSRFVINSEKQMRPNNGVLIGRIGEYTIEKRIILSPQDVEAVKRLTKEHLAYILFKENESEAAQCLVAQPSTPHERSPA